MIFDNIDVTDTTNNQNAIAKEIRSAFTAFANDCPEVFWIGNFSITYNRVTVNGHRNIVTTTVTTSKDANAGETSAETLAIINELEDTLDEYSDLVNENSGNFRFNSDYDKAMLLYTTMTPTITYNADLPAGLKDTVHGALVNHSCACAGYARGFQLLY